MLILTHTRARKGAGVKLGRKPRFTEHQEREAMRRRDQAEILPDPPMGEVHQLILREGIEGARNMAETRAERQAVEVLASCVRDRGH